MFWRRVGPALELKVATMIATPGAPDRAVACLQADYDKSHTVQMLHALETGFVLFFIPLLVLYADLLTKYESANEAFGRVHTLHVDEICDDHRDKYSYLLRLLQSRKWGDRETNFAFFSPQFLVRNPDALAAVLHAVNERMLPCSS